MHTTGTDRHTYSSYTGQTYSQSCSCSCSCSSCSSSGGRRQAAHHHHNTNGSSSSSGNPCHTCSCSYSEEECSCSSCDYGSTTLSRESRTDSGSCHSRYSFRRELLMEIPRLLQFRTAPLTGGASAAEKREKLITEYSSINATHTPPPTTLANIEALSPPPLPVASTPWTHQGSRKTATAQTDVTLLISLLATAPIETNGIAGRGGLGTRSLWKYIPSCDAPTQATPAMITRAANTSPPRCVETASNTECTLQNWGEREEAGRQQAIRLERLERERVGMEIALASAQQYIRQQGEEHHTVIQGEREVFIKSCKELLQQTEQRERALWIEQEYHARMLLDTIWHTGQKMTIRMQQRCGEGKQQLQKARDAWNEAQLQQQWDLISAEGTHRDTLQAAEQQCMHHLQHVFTVAESYRLGSTRATTHAMTAYGEIEQQLQAALQRERALRLEYLHVLQLPTTTIVAHNPQERHPCSTVEDRRVVKTSGVEEREVPVHVRFARAHREALNTVWAQHIRLPTQTRVL